MKTLKYFISMLFILMSSFCGWAQNSVINRVAVLDSSTYSITMGRQSLICDNTGDFHLFYVLHTDTVDYVIHRSSDYHGIAWSPPDTISVYAHTGMPSRYTAFSPTATVDAQNNLHVLYEHRGEPIYTSGYSSYPPSHLNYVTNQTGDWIANVNVLNDSFLQTNQGNGATVSYLNYSQIITYHNHQHYIGYDYAWWATKYNVVYSNNINGEWLPGDTLHSYNLGDYDNIMLNAPALVINNDSLFALWYQRYDCRVEMKSFADVQWSPLKVLYNDVVYPAPKPTSYVVRVESCFNNDEARVAMFRAPESGFNELLLLGKSKNQPWTADTMMLSNSYSIVRPVIIKDTTYIFLVYSDDNPNGSNLVKYIKGQSFTSDSPLSTNTGEQKFFNLVTTGNSVNPIAYLVFDEAKSLYYLKIGELSDITTGVTSEMLHNQKGIKLGQNSPNPFDSKTSISYSIDKPGMVKLHVFDIRGRNVGTLVHSYHAPGNYSIDFNANNLKQGVYFYKITAQGCSVTKKMMIIE